MQNVDLAAILCQECCLLHSTVSTFRETVHWYVTHKSMQILDAFRDPNVCRDSLSLNVGWPCLLLAATGHVNTNARRLSIMLVRSINQHHLHGHTSYYYERSFSKHRSSPVTNSTSWYSLIPESTAFLWSLEIKALCYCSCSIIWTKAHIKKSQICKFKPKWCILTHSVVPWYGLWTNGNLKQKCTFCNHVKWCLCTSHITHQLQWWGIMLQPPSRRCKLWMAF